MRLLVGGVLPLCVQTVSGAVPITLHTGMCDASAAVPAGSSMFVVANDEDNLLRVYQANDPGGPVASFDLAAFLAADDASPEADIEGATLIGNRTYWITSHGANKKGKPRPSRRRLFATELSVHGGTVALLPVGTPYRDLVRDLATAPSLKKYKLGAAARLAPEAAGGLNVEGLSRTPQGGLLIGLRNPLPGGKALIIPLENPAEVVDGKPVRLGEPAVLALGGLGIRSIEYLEPQARYLIVAGPPGDEGDFGLYSWSGGAGDGAQPATGVNFRGLRPEALLVYPVREARVQILSDDGSEPVDGEACKDGQLAVTKKSFRSVWVSP
jgi:hypothetical protein